MPCQSANADVPASSNPASRTDTAAPRASSPRRRNIDQSCGPSHRPTEELIANAAITAAPAAGPVASDDTSSAD